MIDCINQSQLQKFRVDWSGMVYSPTGSSDLLLILGCTTSNFLYLSFSTFYSSALWRTDTTVFAKLNKLPPPAVPSQISPLSLLSPSLNVFEIDKPPGGGGLIEDLRY